MKDTEIRGALKQHQLYSYVADNCNNVKVVDELSISCANVRADIAVINGSLHAYEIKGASDSLKRLSNQIGGYSKVFDYVTVVLEEVHSISVQKLIPAWVGITLCSKSDKGQIEFSVFRDSLKNEHTDAVYIAKMLWRNELIEVLEEYKIKYRKNARNWLLCECLCASLKKELVSNIVRNKLKERTEWK